MDPGGDAASTQCTLLHGYAEHCHRYDALVRALNDAGVAVFGHDHKGHGRSAGRRSYITGFRSLVPDAVTTLRWAAERAPGVPRLLFGHSMGGALAALVAMEHAELVDLLMISSPSVKVSEDISPFLQKEPGVVGTLLPLMIPRLASIRSWCRVTLRSSPTTSPIRWCTTAGFWRAPAIRC